MRFALPSHLAAASGPGWIVRPCSAAERAADSALVSGAFAAIRPSVPGLAVRLARAEDTGAITTLEAAGFGSLRGGGPNRLGPEYTAGRWCENRMGRMLCLVAEDRRGVAAYGLTQVRRAELYIYEICARGGAGQPGHDIFFTLAEMADGLGLRRVTAVLSRPDRAQALLRCYAAVGVHPAAVRGFTLTCGRLPPGSLWLEGSVAEVRAICEKRTNRKEAQHGREEEEPEFPGSRGIRGRGTDRDRVADPHGEIHLRV